jgi:hypothetical protein
MLHNVFSEGFDKRLSRFPKRRLTRNGKNRICNFPRADQFPDGVDRAVDGAVETSAGADQAWTFHGVDIWLPGVEWNSVLVVGECAPQMMQEDFLTPDVVALRPQSMPETATIKRAYKPRAKASGMTWGTVAGDAGKQDVPAAAHDA